MELPAARPTRRGVWPALRRRPLFWSSVTMLLLLVLVSVAPGPIAALFGHPDPRACDLAAGPPGRPAAAILFGTDVQGCDVWRRAVRHGNLAVHRAHDDGRVPDDRPRARHDRGLTTGGWADALIRAPDRCVPRLPVPLAAIVVLNSVPDRSPLVLSARLALFSWPTMARIVRGSVRAVRDSEFVQAATAMGLTHGRIVLTHVLPNTWGRCSRSRRRWSAP
ncbi:ABC transporter permease subunit [Microbacterium sediminis]|uniref:ABC transporter permease subunit n=1 Tax=Microbacterium sediminis TaxID=904291 RepID=UPI0010727FD8|nr:ABC transporter permease subunit [Microbacterium sediminis]QBR73505.1 ABC transporter permease subunit [Microbacterium sediminis]